MIKHYYPRYPSAMVTVNGWAASYEDYEEQLAENELTGNPIELEYVKITSTFTIESIMEIAQVISKNHKFYGKVLIKLNTGTSIFVTNMKYDKIINELYEAVVDHKLN